MLKKKKFFALSLICCLVLSSSFSVFALNQTPANEISGFTDINHNETVVSEVLSFDEIVEMIAESNNITKKEAEIQVVENFYGDDLSSKSLTGDSAITPYNATYRTVSSSFTVTSSYKPTLRFYCQTSEGGSFWGIVKIINIEMNRSNNGMSKEFGGTVFTHLENAGKIFWIVNGDFYNNGTTSANGGVDLKLDESVTLKFGISYATNHYAYCYQEGSYRVQ